MPESEEEKRDEQTSRQVGMQKELQQLHQNGDHVHLWPLQQWLLFLQFFIQFDLYSYKRVQLQ